jgi:signal transduction histidine kinase
MTGLLALSIAPTARDSEIERGSATLNEQSLMEAPPDRTQIRVAIVVGSLWLAGGLASRLFGEIPLRGFPVFIVAVDGMLVISDLVTATLLFAQASVSRSVALLALAAGYLFTALMAIPHALTFPGAFAPDGLLGADLSSTAWISVFWRAGFPLAIGLYALLKRNESLRVRRSSIGISACIGGAFIMAIALSTLAIRGSGMLPSLVATPHVWFRPNAVPVMGTLIALCLAAIAVLMLSEKSRLDVWLLLSLMPWLVHLLLIMSTWGHFAFAWYFAHGAGLVSHVIVMLALIAEASRTYARLAASEAARGRERDARLMSMDAVAAAIAHEVKQPLGAIVTNASAGLRWLDRDPPDLEMVTRSLQANLEQGHRASDLINSIRSVLTRQSGERTTFSLNELVRETAPLLDRELTRWKISLQLVLDETLPPIIADRVQIQQVLINLLTNAIQSLRGTRGHPRHIVVRSSRIDAQDVLLDVSDNGMGISAEKMDHIFDAFFTTKTKGTGMGLSLCRTIVEKHGGRLWASQGDEPGAIFHMQLHAEVECSEVATRTTRLIRHRRLQERTGIG